MTDRLHLDAFLTAVDASPGAFERPNCRGWIGDYQITGKHGHVLADQPGFLRILRGTVTQDGDDEGIIRLDRLPLPAEAEAIRDLIGIRKRRHMTPEALSKLEHARGSIKSPLLAPPIDYRRPRQPTHPST